MWFPPNDEDVPIYDKNHQVVKLKSDEKIEFFLKADIEFTSPEAAALVDEYPPAPVNQKLTGDDVSAYSRSLLIGAAKNPDSYESQKLVTHLKPRKDYILHSSNAQLYTELGMKIVRVTEALKFVSSPFLAKWIKHCTAQRVEASRACDLSLIHI